MTSSTPALPKLRRVARVADVADPAVTLALPVNPGRAYAERDADANGWDPLSMEGPHRSSWHLTGYRLAGIAGGRAVYVWRCAINGGREVFTVAELDAVRSHLIAVHAADYQPASEQTRTGAEAKAAARLVQLAEVDRQTAARLADEAAEDEDEDEDKDEDPACEVCGEQEGAELVGRLVVCPEHVEDDDEDDEEAPAFLADPAGGGTWIVAPEHDARPDDDPEPGDRCKDCGRPVTWTGPSMYDWQHVDQDNEPAADDVADVATLTVCVPSAVAERVAEHLAATVPAVLFLGTIAGVTSAARAGGADPSSWNVEGATAEQRAAGPIDVPTVDAATGDLFDAAGLLVGNVHDGETSADDPCCPGGFACAECGTTTAVRYVVTGAADDAEGRTEVCAHCAATVDPIPPAALAELAAELAHLVHDVRAGRGDYLARLERVADELAGLSGEADPDDHPRGRCDTCGAACSDDVGDCTADPAHPVAVER